VDTDVALSDLHDVLCQHHTKHPETSVVVTGDFDRANLKKVMPNFCQHITCAISRERSSNDTTSGTRAEVNSIARDEHNLSVTEHDHRGL